MPVKIFLKAIKATGVFLWRIDKIKSTGVLLGGIGTFFGVVAFRRTFKPVANADEESGNICPHKEPEISCAEEIGSYLYYRDGEWSTYYKPIKPGDASYLACGLFGLAAAYFFWRAWKKRYDREAKRRQRQERECKRRQARRATLAAKKQDFLPSKIKAHHHIKLVCVGDSAVGKTSALDKFSHGNVFERHISTVFDNHAKFVRHGGKVIRLSLWDTAGPEYYSNLRRISYHGADIFLIYFSLTSESSLTNATQKWVPELKRHVAKYNREHGTSVAPPIVLVGNKMDIWDESKVPESAIEDAVAECDMIKGYKLCSAKSGDGLEETFEEVCRVALASKSISGCS